jgi:hypothetical protein
MTKGIWFFGYSGCRKTFASKFLKKRIKNLILADGFYPFQNEIIHFIERCRNLENQKGLVSSGLSSCKINTNYQFLLELFVKKIFEIIRS